jgi:hypothetical protein
VPVEKVIGKHSAVPEQVALVAEQVAQQRVVPSPKASTQVSPAAQLEPLQVDPWSPLSRVMPLTGEHTPPLLDDPEDEPDDEPLDVPLEDPDEEPDEDPEDEPDEDPEDEPLDDVVVVPEQLGQAEISCATSSEPQPVTLSYPTPALKPVTPMYVLFPLVMSWNPALLAAPRV